MTSSGLKKLIRLKSSLYQMRLKIFRDLLLRGILRVISLEGVYYD